MQWEKSKNIDLKESQINMCETALIFTMFTQWSVIIPVNTYYQAPKSGLDSSQKNPESGNTLLKSLKYNAL